MSKVKILVIVLIILIIACIICGLIFSNKKSNNETKVEIANNSTNTDIHDNYSDKSINEESKEAVTFDQCFGDDLVPLFCRNNDVEEIKAAVKINKETVNYYGIEKEFDGKKAVDEVAFLNDWSIYFRNDSEAKKSIETTNKFIKESKNQEYDIHTTYGDFTIFRSTEFSEHTIRIFYNLNNGYSIVIFCQTDESKENYLKNKYFTSDESEIKNLCDLIKKHVVIYE